MKQKDANHKGTFLLKNWYPELNLLILRLLYPTGKLQPQREPVITEAELELGPEPDPPI